MATQLEEENAFFPLLSLPPEIRQRIYYYALPHSQPKASSLSKDAFPDNKLSYPRLFSAWISKQHSMSLFRVSQLVSEEAIACFFANNTFDIWIPFLNDGPTEIWVLPPVRNSAQGFPELTAGRWYLRVPHRNWRQMRKVSVVFGSSGWVRNGAPRYEWTVIHVGGGRAAVAPDDIDYGAAREHQAGHGCKEHLVDHRVEAFGMVCDLLDVSRAGSPPLTYLQLVFQIPDSPCQEAADVVNCKAVQDLLCDRLDVKYDGKRITTQPAAKPYTHHADRW